MTTFYILNPEYVLLFSSIFFLQYTPTHAVIQLGRDRCVYIRAGSGAGRLQGKKTATRGGAGGGDWVGTRGGVFKVFCHVVMVWWVWLLVASAARCFKWSWTWWRGVLLFLFYIMLFCSEFTSEEFSSPSTLWFSCLGVSEFWMFSDSSSLGGGAFTGSSSLFWVLGSSWEMTVPC